MLSLTLERNEEDRPRFVTLVHYEQRWVPQGDGTEQLHVVPLRRTMEWVRCVDEQGIYDQLICTRVTELPWKAIKPQQAHRDLIAQWKQHLEAITKGAKPVRVEVVP